MKRIHSHLRGRRVRAAAAAIALLVLGSTTACGAGGASDDSENGLRVLVEAGGKAELQPVADAFEEETGSKVTFVELPYDGLYDRLSSELASGSVSFDVAALDAIWLPSFADGLQPLDDLFTDEVKADLFPSLLDEAEVDDSFAGMPVWTNAEILYYRTDLFEDPANQKAFEAQFGYPLEAPTTWEQFQDAAAFFTKDGAYGTDVKGAVETEYLATMLQAGAEDMVISSDGTANLDTPEALEALNYYTALNTDLEVSPPGAAQIDWAAAQNLYNQGKTAMMRFWAHAYTQIPDDSPAKGNTGVTVLPAGPAGTAAVPGAWYLSIPTATEKSDLAQDFIQFAYDHNDLSIDSALGLAARKSAFEKYAGQPGYEHFDALIATLEGPATMPRPAHPKWQQIVDTALIPMIQKAVEPGADKQALLDEAKAQIEEILG
jgi:ABC-type glycerol-3-phosphate transport system substrate-binding protein